MDTHTVKMDEIDFEVTGTYYSGSIGSYEQMPEPRQFEIEKVELYGIDVTGFLDGCYQYKSLNTKIDELEEIVLDKYYSDGE